MGRTARIGTALAAVSALAALAFAAGCSGKPSHPGSPAPGPGGAGGAAGNGQGGTAGTSGGKKLTVAFLMPCAASCDNRFDLQDKGLFTQAVHEIDRNVSVVAQNAQGNGSTQVTQAQAALRAGAGVLVVDPVDQATGAAIAAKAKAAGVPLVSYDTLVTGAPVNYYVAFDGEKVGELEGQYLANRLPAGSTIAILNGPGASAVKAGAHKVLDPLFASGKLKHGYEADARTSTAATGRTLTQQALAKAGTRLAGVLAATDALAEGAVSAVSAAHLTGKVTVTGTGASDTGLRRVLLNTQAMTVYNAIKQEARAAAKIAVAAGRGNAPAAKAVTRSTVDNGAGKVPAVLLTPIIVTSFNLGQTVLADGYTSKQRLCTAEVKGKCPA